MFLSKNADRFEYILEMYPSTIIKFNEKLETLISCKDSASFFSHFDFIIFQILFNIILNENLPNDDKSKSIDKLMELLVNFKTLVNYDNIYKLLTTLLKTNYNLDNLNTLIETYVKLAPSQCFLSLFNELLSYEYQAQQSFLNQIIVHNLNDFKQYKNLVYKIWILLFDENDHVSELAMKIWNNFQLYIDKDFLSSEEFSLAFDEKYPKLDIANKSVVVFARLFPELNGKITERYQNYYLDEINRINTNNLDWDTEKSRLIFFTYLSENINLMSNTEKETLLGFIMSISDKDKNEEMLEQMRKTM